MALDRRITWGMTREQLSKLIQHHQGLICHVINDKARGAIDSDAANYAVDCLLVSINFLYPDLFGSIIEFPTIQEHIALDDTWKLK